MTMSSERPLHDSRLARLIETALGEPARQRAGEPDIEPFLRWFHAVGGPLAQTPAAAVGDVARVIATTAWLDLSVAFSLWSHRMVLAYLSAAGAAPDVQSALARGELIGSTALASGMAHHVTGAPLPITGRREGGDLVLDGRVRWASNLFESGFVLITAAQIEGEGPSVVALRGGTPGLGVDPFPALLALGATASSSLRVSGVRVPAAGVVAADFDGFIRRVRPAFLLLQASFCWGLAARSLHEAAPGLRGPNEVFASEERELAAELDRIESAIVAGLAEPGPIRSLVQLRLEAARLAGSATRLEAKVTGGAGFVATCATARRLREGAFLPIQSPTEGQLLWEASRSS